MQYVNNKVGLKFILIATRTKMQKQKTHDISFLWFYANVTKLYACKMIALIETMKIGFS